MALPGKGADLWLRKNIAETTDGETGEVMYEADEAYMRTNATEAEIAADFEGWYETATNWQPSQPPKDPTQDERLAALEAENKELKEQLNTTMEAVDCLVLGLEEV